MNTNHIVKSYDAELRRLTDEIAEMGKAALSRVDSALQALVQGDSVLARSVIDGDDAIDVREREISHEVLRLLALRQPSARDLREVLAALRTAGDIERVADHAVGIARTSLAMAGADNGLPDGLTELGVAVTDLVRQALQAWRGSDVALARVAWLGDDAVDRMHGALSRELLERLRLGDDDPVRVAHWLYVAKGLERIGDHATNIAENISFMVEGRWEMANPENTY